MLCYLAALQTVPALFSNLMVVTNGSGNLCPYRRIYGPLFFPGNNLWPRIRALAKPKKDGINDGLAQYVKVGVHELDKEKLSPLRNLKYNALADAVADLGKPEEIGKVFAGFQRFLYQEERACPSE